MKNLLLFIIMAFANTVNAQSLKFHVNIEILSPTKIFSDKFVGATSIVGQCPDSVLQENGYYLLYYYGKYLLRIQNEEDYLSYLQYVDKYKENRYKNSQFYPYKDSDKTSLGGILPPRINSKDPLNPNNWMYLPKSFPNPLH